MPKVFIASPGEVSAERDAVAAVVRRFNGEFSQVAAQSRFEAVRWEDSFYTADKPFQTQIDDLLAPCEVVIGIVGMTVGTCDTRLRPSPEAPPYPSATAYEILSSIGRARTGGTPAVYVFFKSRETAFRVTRPEEADEAKAQWSRREAFFADYFDAPDGRSVGAYQTFADPADLAAKVEDLLRRWTRARYGDQPLARWSIDEADSPFPGLDPFDARHAAVYCGRNRKVARAIDLLTQAADGGRSGRRTRPFLLVFGPSGAGKSSLMRAGIAPRLTQPGLVEGVGAWRTALTRPGEQPFADLARALLVTAEGDDPGGFGRALPELGESGLGDPEALAGVLERVAPQSAAGLVLKALDRVSDEGSGSALRRDANLLLLVDQLEELLAESVSRETRQAYATLLAALADTRRVWIVATFRADLYGRLIAERSRSLISLADWGEDYALAPPGPDEVEEIVRHSAELAGLTFETGPDGVRLDDRILKDAAGGDALPLLQFTLAELFKQRRTEVGATYLTVAAYEALGGVDGAIETRAEQAVAGLGPAEQAALERLFRSLVVPVRDRAQGVANSRALALRSAPVGEVMTDAPSRRVVDALLGVRILQSSDQAGEGEGSAHHDGTIKIAHERVLESWSKAQAITERNWEFFSRKADIEAQRQVWEANGRSPAYLIQSGKPAADAAAFGSAYRDELAPDMRDFIASSRSRWRRHRAVGAAAWSLAGLLIAGAAGWGAKQAYQTVVVARVAKGAVGTIATTIGQELSKLEGIQVRVVTQSLQQVDKLIVDLRAKLDEAGDQSGDQELGRSRATMLFYFAKALQLASDIPGAEKAATESLDLRRTLNGAGETAALASRDLADVYDLLGDIERRAARGRPPNFPAALRSYEESFVIRNRMADGAPSAVERDRWLLTLSQSHIRIGDVFRFRDQDRDLKRATEQYRTALGISSDLVLRDPNDDLRRREMSFGLKKLGEMALLSDPPRARPFFEKALCLRRLAAGRGETEWSRDVGFSLMDVGTQRLREGDRTGGKIAFYASLEIRRGLADADTTRPSLEADVATTLHELGRIYLDEESLELASFLFEDALDRRVRLAARFPEDGGYSGPVSITRSLLDQLRQKPAAATLPRLPLSQMRIRIDDEALTFQPEILARRRGSAGCFADLLAELGAVGGAGPLAAPGEIRQAGTP